MATTKTKKTYPSDVEKTSEHSSGVDASEVVDQTFVDPPEQDTLHRGLNARQVWVDKPLFCGLWLDASLDIHDILGRRCWDRSHYWIWHCFSARRTTWYPPRLLCASLLSLWWNARTQVIYDSICRSYMLSGHVFSWRDVCVHSSQKRLRRLCYTFRGPSCRICSRIQLSHEGISLHLVFVLRSLTHIYLWSKYLIVAPNNINAAGAVVNYWHGGRSVYIGVWMSASRHLLNSNA
jgi:hypothetical protein